LSPEAVSPWRAEVRQSAGSFTPVNKPSATVFPNGFIQP
jgi:hypothetical protein